MKAAAFCLVFSRGSCHPKKKENEARKRVIETKRANAHIRSVYHVLCRENAVDANKFARENTFRTRRSGRTVRKPFASRSFLCEHRSRALCVKRTRDDERNEHAMMLIPKPYLASLEYGLISSPPPTSIPPPSPPPPMLSLLGASPYPCPPPLDGSAPPRLLRLIANNFVVVSFMSPSLASRTERTTIGSKSGNMSSNVRTAASNDGSLILSSYSCMFI